MGKKEVFKKTNISVLLSGIAPLFLTLVITSMIILGLSHTESSERSQGLRILEDGIRRAVVTCYAVEGYYPDSIAYIEEHYGIYIDRTKYIVHYDIFSSNMFPDITVMETE